MKKSLVMLMVLSAALLLSAGCASSQKQPVQGASQERYFLGTYSAVFACNMRMMDKAIRATCAKARLTELKRTNNLNACSYLYQDVNQVRMTINVTENKDGSVKIAIKIGGTGDKESSQMLLIEIDNQLRSYGSL